MPRSDDDMFDTGFDPYNALIELNERLLRLETAHNRLANAYQKSENDLSIALDSLQSLQKAYLSLAEFTALAKVLEK